MSAFPCGCDPDIGYRCQRFYQSKDCDYAKGAEERAKELVRQMQSQQTRGWYLVMLAPVRGTEETERYLCVRDASPDLPRVFWNTRENSAFRFPTPEAARAAQEAGGVEGIEHAWIIYRSH